MVLKILLKLLSSDYLISPNHHTTTIFKRAFRLENIYGGEFLEMDILESI